MPRKSPQKVEEPPSFEALLDRLQAIVAELEKGDLPLERSLTLFEEGMGLTRAGMARLDAAEQRVQVLVEASGQLIEQDLDDDEGADEEEDEG